MKTHETHLQILHHFKAGGVIYLRTSELFFWNIGGWSCLSEISVLSLNLTQFTVSGGKYIWDLSVISLKLRTLHNLHNFREGGVIYQSALVISVWNLHYLYTCRGGGGDLSEISVTSLRITQFKAVGVIYLRSLVTSVWKLHNLHNFRGVGDFS